MGWGILSPLFLKFAIQPPPKILQIAPPSHIGTISNIQAAFTTTISAAFNSFTSSYPYSHDVYEHLKPICFAAVLIMTIVWAIDRYCNPYFAFLHSDEYQVPTVYQLHSFESPPSEYGSLYSPTRDQSNIEYQRQLLQQQSQQMLKNKQQIFQARDGDDEKVATKTTKKRIGHSTLPELPQPTINVDELKQQELILEEIARREDYRVQGIAELQEPLNQQTRPMFHLFDIIGAKAGVLLDHYCGHYAGDIKSTFVTAAMMVLFTLSVLCFATVVHMAYKIVLPLIQIAFVLLFGLFCMNAIGYFSDTRLIDHTVQV